VKKVNELEDVLFEAVISELKEAPTAGWAQVARGLLSDYRGLGEDEGDLKAEELRNILKDAAPFKISKTG
tara:strand:+ start:3178 stop:3387 length:210 start_codon:yes stop_codon:yes gene_type:complete